MVVARVNLMRTCILIVCCGVSAFGYHRSETGNSDAADNIFRGKRSASCEEKYATITHGHTACLQRSPSVEDTGVSKRDQQYIIDEHNRLRRDVYPPAKNMRKMSWDEGIAHLAQKWAENCIIGHDERYKRYDFGRFDVGQNLCWSTYEMSWVEAMGLWSNETKHYRYGSSGGVTAISHYTQIIWADTSLVGCGYALCKGTHFYVCNYGPSGNYDMSKPYEAGQSCGDCPYTCSDKLCDCRGKVCLNGGKMDLNTCTCACQKDFNFYTPPYCDLNCTNIKEPEYCQQQFGPQTCEVYANVPQMCPDMCKWCPAAGKKYDSTVYVTRQEKPERNYEPNKQTEPNTVTDTNSSRKNEVYGIQHRESRRRNDYTTSQSLDADIRYKDSDLQRVAGLVQKTLAVKIEPLVHSYVADVNANLEKKAKALEEKNNILKKEVSHLNNKVTKLETDLDSVEQYNRRNTLRITGIPEDPKENIDQTVAEVASAMNSNIKLSEIDSTHRTGKPKGNRPKDIIVRFVSYKAREKLYEARNRLRKTDNYRSVTINDYLTRKRKKLLAKAKKLVKNKILNKAWSEDGNIYVLNIKDKRRKINSESDLEKFKIKAMKDSG